MGVFHQLVDVVNRAPEDITVTFDGQCKTLTPGTNAIPAITVQYAKNQNPIMGTQDPNNPTIHGARYLIGVKGTGPGGVPIKEYEDVPDDCEPLTEEEWQTHLGQPARENVQQAFEENYSNDPRAKLITLGKGRKSTARSRYEATEGKVVNDRTNANFEKDK